MKAVIYARFSSHNQREESIDGQLRECKDFAKRNQIEVIGNYIDRAISAKTDNRPEFQHMIRDSYARQFETVIVYELDRFARNRYDSAIYKAKLKKNGVRVMSAKENITDDPTGIILESMLEGMAEYYSAELAQKINRGMHENVLESKGTGGHLALGYKMNSENKFEIDPVGAALVRQIFKMYGAGSSIKEITAELNAQGARTALGKPFAPNSLDRILRNQKYIGIYKYKDITVPGGVPAIVDTGEVKNGAECKRPKVPVKRRGLLRPADTWWVISPGG
jgi:DNA invertase Pin-like site-specific DNA recombinase